MKISEKFCLPIKGHSDLAFVDIDEVSDTRLFIDPYVIQALQDDFCILAREAIATFFKEVFSACARNDIRRLYSILMHGTEPNEINLGMKSKSNFGKGSTVDELVNLFLSFYRTVSANKYVGSDPLMFCMYMKNFDMDKMSDIIANILRKQLYLFTVEQCKMWNIPLSTKTELLGYYWNSQKLVWGKLYGRPLLGINHNNLLLVPKIILRKRYVLNVACYISQYIIKDMQKDYESNKPELCLRKENKDGTVKIIPPTIAELRKKELKGNCHKDYALKSSAKNARQEERFIRDVLHRIRNGYGSLSDEDIDKLVYCRLFLA